MSAASARSSRGWASCAGRGGEGDGRRVGETSSSSAPEPRIHSACGEALRSRRNGSSGQARGRRKRTDAHEVPPRRRAVRAGRRNAPALPPASSSGRARGRRKRTEAQGVPPRRRAVRAGCCDRPAHPPPSSSAPEPRIHSACGEAPRGRRNGSSGRARGRRGRTEAQGVPPRRRAVRAGCCDRPAHPPPSSSAPEPRIHSACGEALRSRRNGSSGQARGRRKRTEAHEVPPRRRAVRPGCCDRPAHPPPSSSAPEPRIHSACGEAPRSRRNGCQGQALE